MMIQAYVLVQTHVGKAGQVAHELQAIDGVMSSEPLSGPYDVVARVRAADLDHLGRLVADKIQGVGGVSRTLTCVISGSAKSKRR